MTKGSKGSDLAAVSDFIMAQPLGADKEDKGKPMIILDIPFEVSRDDLVGAALRCIGSDSRPHKVERPAEVLDIVRRYIRMHGCTEKPNCHGSDILEREYVDWGDDIEGNLTFHRRLAKAEALVDKWWPALKGVRRK